MKKLFFLLPVLLLADVDPFKAGLNSANPYGLTPQEKAILKNQKAIQQNRDLILNLDRKLRELNSSISQKFIMYDSSISDIQTKLLSFKTILSEIDSLKQEIDALKKKYVEYKEKLKTMNELLIQEQKKIEALEQQNAALKSNFAEIVKINNQNIQNLRTSLQEVLAQLKKVTTPMSAKEAFKKARKLFFDGKFDKAKELFSYSLEKKYLPATSAYYLGEIAYKEKNYKEALAFYKQSVSIYPKKTSFAERLLYHTAKSFKYLGEDEKAKLTFKKLINDYPSSKYAKLAQKELEK